MAVTYTDKARANSAAEIVRVLESNLRDFVMLHGVPVTEHGKWYYQGLKDQLWAAYQVGCNKTSAEADSMVNELVREAEKGFYG